jgi:hypothetical protein
MVAHILLHKLIIRVMTWLEMPVFPTSLMSSLLRTVRTYCEA